MEDDIASLLITESCKSTASTVSVTMMWRDTYLLAADTVLQGQQAFVVNSGGTAAFALPEMSLPLASARLSFAASALDFIAEPFPVDCVSTAEGMLICSVRFLAQRGPLVADLSAAWERLQRSGALHRRNVEGGIALGSRVKIEAEAAAKAAVEQRGLRSCALAGCAAREVSVSQYKSCGACTTVAYCCKEHQVAAWPGHKAACKAARKEAASGT